MPGQVGNHNVCFLMTRLNYYVSFFDEGNHLYLSIPRNNFRNKIKKKKDEKKTLFFSESAIMKTKGGLMSWFACAHVV